VGPVPQTHVLVTLIGGAISLGLSSSRQTVTIAAIVAKLLHRITSVARVVRIGSKTSRGFQSRPNRAISRNVLRLAPIKPTVCLEFFVVAARSKHELHPRPEKGRRSGALNPRFATDPRLHLDRLTSAQLGIARRSQSLAAELHTVVVSLVVAFFAGRTLTQSFTSSFSSRITSLLWYGVPGCSFGMPPVGGLTVGLGGIAAVRCLGREIGEVGDPLDGSSTDGIRRKGN
jgi:hypothetical protein